MKPSDLYALYVTALPWALTLGVIMGSWRGWRRGDWTLFRCVAIVGMGQVGTELWLHANAGSEWRGQPYGLYLVIYTASAVLASIRPSGKLCSIMAGIFIAGVAASVLALSFEYAPARDLLFWQTAAILAFLQLAALIGGATSEGGRRICIALGRGLARVAQRARAGWLA